MKKQTAVEWLKDWMGKNQYFIGNDLLEAIEQAKAMEKEEYDIFDKYLEDEKHFGISDKKTIERVQLYYRTYFSQTYGGDE